VKSCDTTEKTIRRAAMTSSSLVIAFFLSAAPALSLSWPYGVQSRLPISPHRNQYLPGLGTFGTTGLRSSRSQGSTPAEYNSPAQHAKLGSQNPFTISGQKLTPQEVDDGGGKCGFVQMKGGPLPGGACHEGGMACEKQCDYEDDEVDKAADGQNCRVVMEEVCSEVASPHCSTVMESVCEPIQQTVCDDDVEPQSQTRSVSARRRHQRPLCGPASSSHGESEEEEKTFRTSFSGDLEQEESAMNETIQGLWGEKSSNSSLHLNRNTLSKRISLKAILFLCQRHVLRYSLLRDPPVQGHGRTRWFPAAAARCSAHERRCGVRWPDGRRRLHPHATRPADDVDVCLVVETSLDRSAHK